MPFMGALLHLQHMPTLHKPQPQRQVSRLLLGPTLRRLQMVWVAVRRLFARHWLLT